MRRRLGIVLFLIMLLASDLNVRAYDITLTSQAAVLMEASTGEVIYEKNANDHLSPASITKIMTLDLIFEALENKQIELTDYVTTSTYASSMGGSQVYLAENEIQTVETMIKCIVIASANDASVAMAELIAGSEEAFVAKMNEKAVALGMMNTHFEDCCGLTSSDNHYTSAYDVALMSRDLIINHPDIFWYTKIWMEDIVHTTRQGTSTFTLASTNKLLKQYEWTTGLKTGSTQKAKYCFSATANKNGIEMIAVVMAAPDYKVRFSEASSLLEYGYSVSSLYQDENIETLPDADISGSLEKTIAVRYKGPFSYLETGGNDITTIDKEIRMLENIKAPIKEGDILGKSVYLMNGEEIGSIDIISCETIDKAGYRDFVGYIIKKFLF